MRQDAILFEPIIEVRDLLESFLIDQVLLEGWRDTLSKASTRFVELGIQWSDVELVKLGRNVGALATNDLVGRPELTRTVARAVEEVLDGLHIPGIPVPSDTDWTF